MDKTKIEWADATWNPVTGCLHSCEYCYARGIANRFSKFEPRCGGEVIPDGTGTLVGSIWNTTHGETLHVFDGQPMRRERCGDFVKASYPYGFEPTLHRYRLDIPARWKHPRNIFVCSMADLFGAWVPDEWIVDVFAACAAAPQHNYMFLTKNTARYEELEGMEALPINNHLWYGSTVTTADDTFYGGKPYNTFASIEPIMERFHPYTKWVEAVNWIIIGAETGKRKSKIVPKRSWIEELCEAADAAGTPVFMKNSLIPIMGTDNMRREFPEGLVRTQ